MSISSRIWNVADFALNLALCIIFIINSTYVDRNKTPARIPESNRLIELVLALVFLGQYSANLVHSGLNWFSQFKKSQSPSFTFLDAIYFIVIRKLEDIDSLNPGGSIPLNVFSIILSIFIIALIAFLLPSRATKLANLALKTSSYDRSIALPKYSRHTVVCGHIELEPVRKFLQEYIIGSDSITFASTIAILHSDEPSMEMKAMLQEPEFVNHVFYVKGHATDFSALKKARVDVAKCVYILADKHSPGSGVEEDVGTRMTMMAVSVFGVSSNQAHQTDKRRKNLSPKIKVFAQTLLPGSISHLAYPQTTRVMCVDEMRMGIMAQNCATPGFAALAYMLSTSVSKHADWDLSGALEENIAKSAGVGSSQLHSLPSHTGHNISSDSKPRYYQTLLAPRNYKLQENDILFYISTEDDYMFYDMDYDDRKALRTKIVPRAMQYTDADGLSFGANPLSSMPNPCSFSERSTGGTSVHSSPFPQAEFTDNTSATTQSHQFEFGGRQINLVPQDIHGHIVICDTSNSFPRNIELLVQALKSDFANKSLGIVILSPGEPDNQCKLAIQKFTHVYHVHGTPLALEDLKRAHIESALKAIVLGTCNKRTYMGIGGTTSTDTAAILAHRRSKLRTVDFLRHLTLSHLTDTPEANAIKPFNPGQLNLLVMPDHYIGQSYSTMVRYMMEYYAVVPLAILRVSPTNGQPLYSVICNPRPSTIMDEADAVYMLGPPIPGWNELSMGPRKTGTAPQPLHTVDSSSATAFVTVNESG
ncbi:hypothetical protein BX661DRAFT_169053 [Kickxella alabastrina]|uniref:uncharacterized protein n=1 Tax=Kickxella alabastrina TaxID=61397 RepID=UPI00221ED7F9|nr:uncharacterized protein BX661DRAFT_169053 [Kickxella alabastrina]KAI7833953.1 hypothetical protein BX661DRAFT_169053 [Kickxella alabastrina]